MLLELERRLLELDSATLLELESATLLEDTTVSQAPRSVQALGAAQPTPGS
jgi:hypothetical protein